MFHTFPLPLCGRENETNIGVEILPSMILDIVSTSNNCEELGKLIAPESNSPWLLVNI